MEPAPVSEPVRVIYFLPDRAEKGLLFFARFGTIAKQSEKRIQGQEVMLTNRSPKPLLRVRVLLPLPENSRLERDGCFLRIRRHRKRGSRGSLLCRFRFLTWPPGTAATYLGITKKRIWCNILLCAVAGYACFSGRCRKGRLSGAGKRSIPSQCTKERILLPRPDRAAAGEKENGK